MTNPEPAPTGTRWLITVTADADVILAGTATPDQPPPDDEGDGQ